MEQKKIPFKGINRCYDDGIADDGCCMELINARIRNGSVEPMGKPTIVKEGLSNVEKVYFHTQANRALTISSNGSVDVYSYDLSEYLNPLSSDLTGTKRIEFIGNVAVFFLEETTRYCIFRDGEYKYLGGRPKVPNIYYIPVGKAFNVSPETKLLVGRDSDGYSNDEFYASLQFAESGMYDNCIDTANKQRYFFGSIFFVAALRMLDGSYLAYSPIKLVEASNDVSFDFRCGGSDVQQNVTMGRLNALASCHIDPNNTSKRYARCEAAAYCTNVDFLLDSFESADLWKDIITSIDVYVAPFSFFTKNKTKYRTGVEFESYQNVSGKYAKEEIMQKASMFYKYAEFNLDGKQTWIIDDVSTDNLALQQRLEFSDMMYAEGVTHTYVYNNRLHIAGYRYRFNKDYTINLVDNIYPPGEVTRRDVHFYFYIETNKGTSIIHVVSQAPRSTITPYLMYYDNRAYKVFAAWADDNGTWHGKEFELNKHKTLNIAYYAEWVETQESSIKKINLALSINLEDFPTISSLPKEQNEYEEIENVLKVSNLNNPFVFPATQTYQPSQASIVGFCSNTQAISQGQFGQHPLYVFTDDGIYAMNVDTSGGIVYSSQSVVSRNVCINPNSIVGIDSAVLFATDKGLMSISGAQTTLLSSDLDGYLPSCISSSLIMVKVAEVAQLSNALSVTEFRDYIKEANVGYSYADSEIIVSNTAYPYSYIFNLNSSSWSKVNYSVYSFTNKYPECYALMSKSGLKKDNGLFNLHNPHRSVNSILILTKPVKMGTNSHKRVLQSALRALVHPSQSDLYFRGEPVMFRDEQVGIFSNIGLYILGSNDAEHFELVHGKESIKDVRDLVTKMNKSRAYKYFMIALAGGVRTDVAINYMEFLIDDAYTNRLR